MVVWLGRWRLWTQAENFVWDRYVHWLGHVVQIHVCRLELTWILISLIYGIALWIPWSLQTIPQAPARSALFFTMGYLVGPAVLWPREGILETRLVSSQTFYAAPGFGVWYSGFSYDHKRVRVLERPISPEKTRLTKNFRRWPWCSNAWRDSGRAYPLLRRQNRALLSEWPNLIALNFAFF